MDQQLLLLDWTTHDREQQLLNDEELKELKYEIVTLQYIQEEINVLIDKQQANLEEIDSSTENAGSKTEIGKEDLKVAQKYYNYRGLMFSTATGAIIGGPTGVLIGIKYGGVIIGALGGGIIGKLLY